MTKVSFIFERTYFLHRMSKCHSFWIFLFLFSKSHPLTNFSAVYEMINRSGNMCLQWHFSAGVQQ